MRLPLPAHALLVCVALLAPLVTDVVAFELGLELPGERAPLEVAILDEANWLVGDGPTKLDRALSGGSLITRWLVPHYNALLLRTLGRSAPAARRRDEGWLFIERRAAALTPRRYDELAQQVPARVAREVEEVEARGYRVVVAIVPDRARVHADRAYPSGQMPAHKARYLDTLLTTLRARGVEVVSLLPPLQRLLRAGGRPFYRADHHWTSEAAQVAAQALDRSIDDAPRGCAVPGFRPFEVRWAMEREPTSVLPKLGMPAAGTVERAYGHTHRRATLVRRGHWDPRHAPVVYVTSSYGRWRAPEMLSRLLACPVTQVRRGPSFGAHDTLAGRLERQADPRYTRLVVWELLEYGLYYRRGAEPGLED